MIGCGLPGYNQDSGCSLRTLNNAVWFLEIFTMYLETSIIQNGAPVGKTRNYIADAVET